MQRKGNAVKSVSQVSNEKEISVGVDMGGTLWATTYHFWEAGDYSYHKYKDNDVTVKEELLFSKVQKLVNEGYKVHVYYEAGKYGFVPARILEMVGAEVTILPVNKLKILSCGKQVKTDRIDSRFLAELHPTDKLPRVYIPTIEEEARRGAVREAARLKKEIRRKNSRLICLLEKSGIYHLKTHQGAKFWKDVIREWNKPNNRPPFISELTIKQIKNLIKEIALLEKLTVEWEKEMRKEEEKERQEAEANNGKCAREELIKFRGIGDILSRTFSWELGNFHRFKNGRHISSFFGLVPVHWSSGKMNKDQGISKSGNPRLRTLAIEMAWLWVRYQSECEIVKKWLPKLEKKGRQRKTAIVGLAHQLIVALFRHIKYGDEIKGAIINK